MQGTRAALHGTQQTTEQVIQAVVTQVQAGFQQEQQGHQTAVEQLSQAVQTLQAQVQQIPNAAADQLQQIGQAMQTVQNQMQQQITPGQFQQLTQAFQDLQGQVQVIGQGQTGSAMPQPGAPHGSPTSGPTWIASGCAAAALPVRKWRHRWSGTWVWELGAAR